MSSQSRRARLGPGLALGRGGLAYCTADPAHRVAYEPIYRVRYCADCAGEDLPWEGPLRPPGVQLSVFDTPDGSAVAAEAGIPVGLAGAPPVLTLTCPRCLTTGRHDPVRTPLGWRYSCAGCGRLQGPTRRVRAGRKGRGKR